MRTRISSLIHSFNRFCLVFVFFQLYALFWKCCRKLEEGLLNKYSSEVEQNSQGNGIEPAFELCIDLDRQRLKGKD